MKTHVLIFTSGIFSCASVFAQDTLARDSVAEEFISPVDVNAPLLMLPDIRLSDSISRGIDSDTTAMRSVDQPICVSIAGDLVLPTTSSPPDSVFTCVVEFIPSYMWYWSPPPPCLVCTEEEGNSHYTLTVVDPYNISKGLSIVDSTTQIDSMVFVYTSTNTLEVSSVPPLKNPEPTQPGSIPNHFWFEAVLPSSRPRKNS